MSAQDDWLACLHVRVHLWQILSHGYLPYDLDEALALHLVVDEFWHSRIVLHLFTDHKDRRIVLCKCRLLHPVKVLLKDCQSC